VPNYVIPLNQLPKFSDLSRTHRQAKSIPYFLPTRYASPSQLTELNNSLQAPGSYLQKKTWGGCYQIFLDQFDKSCAARNTKKDMPS